MNPDHSGFENNRPIGANLLNSLVNSEICSDEEGKYTNNK